MPIFDFMAPFIKLFICILSIRLRIAKKTELFTSTNPLKSDYKSFIHIYPVKSQRLHL